MDKIKIATPISHLFQNLDNAKSISYVDTSSNVFQGTASNKVVFTNCYFAFIICCWKDVPFIKRFSCNHPYFWCDFE